jgi:hypothetical protein
MSNVILKDIELSERAVFIDYTIVFGTSSAEQFLKSLERVFAAMVTFNVRLKPSKCEFGFSTVTFLGHVFFRRWISS